MHSTPTTTSGKTWHQKAIFFSHINAGCPALNPATDPDSAGDMGLSKSHQTNGNANSIEAAVDGPCGTSSGQEGRQEANDVLPESQTSRKNTSPHDADGDSSSQTTASKIEGIRERQTQIQQLAGAQV